MQFDEKQVRAGVRQLAVCPAVAHARCRPGVQEVEKDREIDVMTAQVTMLFRNASTCSAALCSHSSKHVVAFAPAQAAS